MSDDGAVVDLGGCVWVRQGGEWHSYIHGRVASTEGRAYEFHEALDRIAELEAGLPGTGVVRSPENAPDSETDAAPVPDPAHICADDDEC